MKKTTIYQILLAIAILAIILLIVKPFKCCGNAESACVKTEEAETTCCPGHDHAAHLGEWKAVSIKDLVDNPVKLFADDWMALTAGKKGDLNTMTIAWGTIGNLWGKPIVTVYVSTDRHTFGFMERNDYFTVTAFPEEDRGKLRYIGSHSGRDGDKIADAGLTVEYTELGNPTFTDGRLMIECRKIYADQFNSDLFNEETAKIYSKGMGVHQFYIGEIVNVWMR